MTNKYKTIIEKLYLEISDLEKQSRESYLRNIDDKEFLGLAKAYARCADLLKNLGEIN